MALATGGERLMSINLYKKNKTKKKENFVRNSRLAQLPNARAINKVVVGLLSLSFIAD